MISPETLDRVRQGTDIVELVGRYVPLKRVGRYYRGLCPFHTERSPSFYVSPDRQIYHCFGCGVGGNAFGFVMAYEKLTFPEAVKKLADQLGIALEIDRAAGKSEPVYEVCAWATEKFRGILNSTRGAPAQEYLDRRQLSRATAEKFQLGYAPGGNLLSGEAKKSGYPPELLRRAGLVAEKDGQFHDWFWERLMFPIFSPGGRVIAFGGRPLDEERTPKYLNSPETEVFRKGENLYGLYQGKAALREQGAFLVEGYFDHLSLFDRGFENVVAPLGTALTESQARVLRRYTPHVTVFFDGDASGVGAAKRALRTLLGAGLEVRVALLPRDVDPDLLVRRQGAEAIGRYATEAVDFGEFLIRISNPRSLGEKVTLAREAVGLLALVTDQIRFEVYLNRLAELLAISKEVLKREAQRRPPVVTPPVAPRRSTPMRRLMALALQGEGRIRFLAEKVPPEWFEEPTLVELARLLYGRQPTRLVELLDELEVEEQRKLVTELGFEQGPVSEDEFERCVGRIVLDQELTRLRAELARAEAAQDAEQSRKLQVAIQSKSLERSKSREKPKVAG